MTELEYVCSYTIATGKGKIGLLDSVEKFTKKKSRPTWGIKRKADSFYSHSQRWTEGEGKQADIYCTVVWNIIASQKGDIYIFFLFDFIHVI